MAIAILNYDEADRRSARAGEDSMEIGNVVEVVDDGAGGRKAILLTDGATAVPTAWGILWKVRMDGRRVVTTTSLSTKQLRDFGDARTYVDSGDQVVVVRRGAIIEFDSDSLHTSVYTTGVLNVQVGDALVVKGSLLAKSGTSGANTSTSFARVYALNGTKLFAELL